MGRPSGLGGRRVSLGRMRRSEHCGNHQPRPVLTAQNVCQGLLDEHIFLIYDFTIFTKSQEVKLLLPNSRRINRGGHDMKSIVDACKAHAVTDLVMLSETRGVPDAMI